MSLKYESGYLQLRSRGGSRAWFVDIQRLAQRMCLLSEGTFSELVKVFRKRSAADKRVQKQGEHTESAMHTREGSYLRCIDFCTSQL